MSLISSPLLSHGNLLPNTPSSDLTKAGERKAGIELGRLAAAFSVIVIHQNPAGYGSQEYIYEGMNQAARWAVPFFFILSGYLMPTNSQWVSVARKYIVRIGPIFLFWCLMYLLVLGDIFEYVSDFKSLIRLLVTGGPGYHLWFLPSLCVSIIIALTFLHFQAIRALAVFASLLFISALAFSTYSPAIYGFNPIGFHMRNGPFFGLIFISLGIIMRKNIITPKAKTGWLLLFSGAILSASEILFLYNRYGAPINKHDFLLGTLPLALGASFIFLDMNIKSHTASRLFRALGAVSLGIYAVHVYVLYYFTGLFSPNSLAGGLATAVVAMAASSAIALVGGQIPMIRKVFR